MIELIRSKKQVKKPSEPVVSSGLNKLRNKIQKTNEEKLQ